jgi:hypothetical protein
MHSLARDLHFACRQLRRHPGFALACILTLTVGTGAATALFSIVDGVLLRPLPYPEPDRLAAVSAVGTSSPGSNEFTPHDTSYLNYRDWERLNHTFSSMAAYSTVPRLFAHADGSAGRVLNEDSVSANLFATLGIAPLLGRAFNAEDERPGARTAILSYELWASDFASSPTASTSFT